MMVNNFPDYMWWLKNKELFSYAWYDDFFTKSELDKIENMVKDEELQTGVVGLHSESLNGSLKTRNSDIKFIETKGNEWIFKKLTDLIFEVNEKYFNIDLTVISCIQYTSYKKGQFYAKHLDMFNSPIDNFRKLSFTLQLSDPKDYEGGDLVIHEANSFTMKKNRGHIVFFPTYVLHEVTPVTRGVRKSLVGWISGPRWK